VGSIPASRTRISILEHSLEAYAPRLFFFVHSIFAFHFRFLFRKP